MKALVLIALFFGISSGCRTPQKNSGVLSEGTQSYRADAAKLEKAGCSFFRTSSDGPGRRRGGREAIREDFYSNVGRVVLYCESSPTDSSSVNEVSVDHVIAKLECQDRLSKGELIISHLGSSAQPNSTGETTTYQRFKISEVDLLGNSDTGVCFYATNKQARRLFEAERAGQKFDHFLLKRSSEGKVIDGCLKYVGDHQETADYHNSSCIIDPSNI